jgi:hypothetical protein
VTVTWLIVHTNTRASGEWFRLRLKS